MAPLNNKLAPRTSAPDARSHLCPDCLSLFKRLVGGHRGALKMGAAWGSRQWPLWIYHTEHSRKCFKHYAEALANGAARRAGLNEATPVWVDRKAITKVYEESTRLTATTGIRHEVDHIEPLNGKASRGLHVPWNLRPIPAHINRKKSNKINFTLDETIRT